MSTSPAAVPGQPPTPADLSSQTNFSAFAARFVDLWWVDVPCKLRQWSTLLWAAWSDGIYLTAWPRLSTVLIVAVLLFGFVQGGTHWSVFTLDGNGLSTSLHAASFAQMLPLMVLAVVLGSLSANLGLMLVLGFAVGDFFWAGPPYVSGHSVPVPLFLYAQVAAYLVFFFLAVWPTVATKFLVASAHRQFRESELWKTVLMVIVQALFIYEWTYFAPIGVKEQWDCCSATSPLDVRYFHQVSMPWLVGAAVLGVLARCVLISVAERRDPNVLARLSAVCDPAWASDPRMPGWLHAILGAAIMSLLLLGFSASPERTGVMFLVVTALLLARIYGLPRLSLWKSWSARVVRLPALLRLTAATVATYLICRGILMIPGFGASEGYTFGNFGPELGAILAGFVAVLLLLPNGALAPEENESVDNPLPVRLPVPSGVVQAGIILALVLLATKKAFAGACLDTRCCFGGDNGLASSATAASAPSVSSAAPKSTPEGPQPPLDKGRRRWAKGSASVHAAPSARSPIVGWIPSGSPFVYDNGSRNGGSVWFHVTAGQGGGPSAGWVEVTQTSPNAPDRTREERNTSSTAGGRG